MGGTSDAISESERAVEYSPRKLVSGWVVGFICRCIAVRVGSCHTVFEDADG